MTSLFSRTDQSVLGRWWWTVDRIMLAALLTLAVCGVVLVATAGSPVAERLGLSPSHFIVRHLIVLVPSLIAMLAVSMLNARWVWRLASVVLPAAMAAMVLVLFIGMEIKGARRWIDLPFFSLQPSEFVKPSFTVVSAWFMARQKENPDFPGTGIAAGLFAAVAALLLLQPDLGMTFVLVCIFGAQVFLAGLPLQRVAALGGIAAAGLGASYFIFDHVRSRIDRFVNPAAGDTYQVDKALEAFREGGFAGVGPGQGTIKNSIPDAHADFVFAVVGEEMGLIFAAFLVLVFAFIVLRGLSRAMDSDDIFRVLAAGGLFTMFGLQALIHMGSNVQMLPAKGMTLPLASYGGSSLLAIALAMGMALSLTRREKRFGVTGLRRSGRARQRASEAA